MRYQKGYRNNIRYTHNQPSRNATRGMKTGMIQNAGLYMNLAKGMIQSTELL